MMRTAVTEVNPRLVRAQRRGKHRQAMAFVNRVADAANEQNHHPDIQILYNRVRLALSTHKVGGLSGSDFVMAAKIDRLAEDAVRDFQVRAARTQVGSRYRTESDIAASANQKEA